MGYWFGVNMHHLILLCNVTLCLSMLSSDLLRRKVCLFANLPEILVSGVLTAMVDITCARSRGRWSCISSLNQLDRVLSNAPLCIGFKAEHITI